MSRASSWRSCCDESILHRRSNDRAIRRLPVEHLEVAGLLHISKCYDRRMALRDVTLGVEPGEIVGLVGPNGAGLTAYFGGEHTIPGDVSARRWTCWRSGDVSKVTRLPWEGLDPDAAR